MTTPDEDGAPTRAELERIAYGRADTPAQVAAAQDALRRLVEEDAAVAVAARTDATPEVVPEPVIPPELADFEAPARRRRTLVPLLVIAGLFAGAIIGVLVTRPAPSPSIGVAGSAPVTPAPEPTPNAAAAIKLLVAPQTKADTEFPFPITSGPSAIQPASIHRVLAMPDGATLWIGRSDTGICLMWSRDPATDGGVGGGVTCASPTVFARRGLTLSEGDYGWTWNGLTFTTTVGQ